MVCESEEISVTSNNFVQDAGAVCYNRRLLVFFEGAAYYYGSAFTGALAGELIARIG